MVSNEGLVRGNSLHEGAAPDAEALGAMVLRATAHPASDGGTPERPPEVRLSETGPVSEQAAALAERLDAAGITVRATSTERADEVIRQLAAHLSQHEEAPYFTAYSEDEVRAFFDAARAFYEAAPWRRIEPVGGQYLAPHRYAAEAVHQAPRLLLSAYRALLDAVREAVARRRADPITSIKETFTTTGEHAVDLRYPSKGEEIVPPDPGGVKLTAYDPETDEVLLRVRAPGAATLYDVARAVQQERAGLYPAAFGSGEASFWENGVQHGQPMPYVFQLLALDDLWMEEDWEDCPMEAERLAAGDVPDDVEVDVLP